MKKTFFILSIAMLALASCKKDYTCTCTSTYSNTDGDSSVGAADKITLKKVKKSTAANSTDCVSYTTTNKEPGYSETLTVTCDMAKN